MNQIKKLFAVVLLMATAVSASAKELDYKPFPHMFVGIQGGAQTTWTNYDQLKLITPTASVYFGGWFTPVVGARLHVNGIWNKGGYDDLAVPDFTYKYKYVTTNLDLMLNLVTLFGKKDFYPVNVYLIGGIGLNTAWDNDDAYAQKLAMPLAWDGTRLSHNARVGAMLEWVFAKHWGLNLEVSANSLNDRYNSKIGNKDDWSLTAQLGLAYKFGFKKGAKAVAPSSVSTVGMYNDDRNTDAVAATPEYATRIDTTWYDDVTYKEVPGVEKLEKNIYYEIRSSELADPQVEIDAIADFVKSHKNCKVTVTGYADKGTGTPAINKKYSQQRADRATKALVKAGVPANIITTKALGDTVQPFADNDKNRVVITVATGDGTTKEKVVTKKFRTKEVRYQVK